MVAMTGQEARFLAGGEFPIPLASGFGTVQVEFKKFGIQLKFTPTVLSDGLINLKLATEVSEIDNSLAGTIGGARQRDPGPQPSLGTRRRNRVHAMTTSETTVLLIGSAPEREAQVRAALREVATVRSDRSLAAARTAGGGYRIALVDLVDD